jgi:hypothetical protein
MVHIDRFAFGEIAIDGVAYEYDVLIDRGKIRRRKKKHSKKFRSSYGHTPLSMEEEIPWKCRRLVVGTGVSGAMPVAEEVKQEALRRKVELVILPTQEAIQWLQKDQPETNAISLAEAIYFV